MKFTCINLSTCTKQASYRSIHSILVEVIEQAGQPQQNESTGGKLDFQGKAALSNHTAQARQQAETKAREEGITDTVKIRQKQLQAALQVGYDQKMRKYAQAKKDGIVVTPLIFSSGGTVDA